MYLYWDIWTCYFKMFCVFFGRRGLKKIFLSKIEISFLQNVERCELITNHLTCIYPLCTVTEIFGLVTSKCIVFGGEAQKNFFVQNRNLFVFQNVELVELITNHHTCNYLSFTVTEIFGFVTSKCIVFLGGLKKIFLSKIEISSFHNVELSELITNHPNCNYLSCTVTEIFGLVTSKCIVFWGRGLKKIFLSKIEISFFQNVEVGELITNYPTCNYPSCILTEIFGLVFPKCIV